MTKLEQRCALQAAGGRAAAAVDAAEAACAARTEEVKAAREEAANARQAAREASAETAVAEKVASEARAAATAAAAHNDTLQENLLDSEERALYASEEVQNLEAREASLKEALDVAERGMAAAEKELEEACTREFEAKAALAELQDAALSDRDALAVAAQEVANLQDALRSERAASAALAEMQEAVGEDRDEFAARAAEAEEEVSNLQSNLQSERTASAALRESSKEAIAELEIRLQESAAQLTSLEHELSVQTAAAAASAAAAARGEAERLARHRESAQADDAAAAVAAAVDAARKSAERQFNASLAVSKDEADAALQAEREISAQRVAAARELLVSRMGHARLERVLRERGRLMLRKLAAISSAKRRGRASNLRRSIHSWHSTTSVARSLRSRPPATDIELSPGPLLIFWKKNTSRSAFGKWAVNACRLNVAASRACLANRHWIAAATCSALVMQWLPLVANRRRAAELERFSATQRGQFGDRRFGSVLSEWRARAHLHKSFSLLLAIAEDVSRRSSLHRGITALNSAADHEAAESIAIGHAAFTAQHNAWLMLRSNRMACHEKSVLMAAAQASFLRRLRVKGFVPWRTATLGVRPRPRPTDEAARLALTTIKERRQSAAALCALHLRGCIARPMRRVRQRVALRRLSTAFQCWQLGKALQFQLKATRLLGEGQSWYARTRWALARWRPNANTIRREKINRSFADAHAGRSGAWRRQHERTTKPAALAKWAAATCSAGLSRRAIAVRLASAWRTWNRQTGFALAWDSREANAAWCLTFHSLQRSFAVWVGKAADGHATSEATAAAANLQSGHMLRRWWRYAFSKCADQNDEMHARAEGAPIQLASALRRFRSYLSHAADEQAYNRVADGMKAHLRMTRAIRAMRAQRSYSTELAELECVGQLRWRSTSERSFFYEWSAATKASMRITIVAAIVEEGRNARDVRAMWAALIGWNCLARSDAVLHATERLAMATIVRQRMVDSLRDWWHHSVADVAFACAVPRAHAFMQDLRARRAVRSWAAVADSRAVRRSGLWIANKHLGVALFR